MHTKNFQSCTSGDRMCCTQTGGQRGRKGAPHAARSQTAASVDTLGAPDTRGPLQSVTLHVMQAAKSQGAKAM